MSMGESVRSITTGRSEYNKRQSRQYMLKRRVSSRASMSVRVNVAATQAGLIQAGGRIGNTC